MARILIVDDERDVVELLAFLLQRDGHQVMAVYDGQEGLDSALRERPDLIILDIMMPEMDGYTMNQKLLSHATAGEIPVIVLTARGGLQEVSSRSPNIRFHVEKPFDPLVLLAHVVEILGQPRRT